VTRRKVLILIYFANVFQTDDKINSEPKIKKLEPVLLPGEIVVNEVNFVRKCIATDTSQYDLWGKLICSNFKISFITDDPMPLQRFHYRNLLLGEHDVPLTCIEQIVTVNDHKRKQKVLGPNQKLKFNPTELIIYCKDFRIVRFRFDESGPESAKKPIKLMGYPQEAAVDLVAAASKKLRSLRRTQTGTEKSSGQVLPDGEFVLLTRVT
uniref:Myotubularin related protein 10 n=1 Tax=Ursus maritimus TaxID=29073 RepID=A0A452VFU1_URSMA